MTIPFLHFPARCAGAGWLEPVAVGKNPPCSDERSRAAPALAPAARCGRVVVFYKDKSHRLLLHCGLSGI